MSPNNTDLVEYGIQTEKSDWRAHVCWKVARVFYYPTDCGVRAVESGKYQDAAAYQEIDGRSVKTATGKLVPPRSIGRCTSYKIPSDLRELFTITRTHPPNIKGEFAVQIVKAMVLRGLMPPMVPLAEEQGDLQVQIEGVDIIITSNFTMRLQVKCDFDGGPSDWGGTGNLYLQTAECNPLGLH